MRPCARDGLLAAGVALGLAACVGAPVETRRVVSGDPAEVRGRIEAELARLGLTPVPGTGSAIEARAAMAPTDWAACGPALVGGGGDNKSRRMATARAEHAAVRVTLTPAGGGTEVHVAPTFAGTYRNPVTTYSFERACRSNGVLESRLLAAAGARATG